MKKQKGEFMFTKNSRGHIEELPERHIVASEVQRLLEQKSVAVATYHKLADPLPAHARGGRAADAFGPGTAYGNHLVVANKCQSIADALQCLLNGLFSSPSIGFASGNARCSIAWQQVNEYRDWTRDVTLRDAISRLQRVEIERLKRNPNHDSHRQLVWG